MYILAIYIDGDYFKVSLLSDHGKRIRIELLQEFQKSELDLALLKNSIEEITKGESFEVITPMLPKELFVRRLVLPLTRKSALMAALPFQVESIVPFVPEESIVLPTFKRMGKKSTTVVLHAYLHRVLQRHVEEIRVLGFDPDWVSAVNIGLHAFAKRFAPEEKNLILFHYGWDCSFLVSMIDGELDQTVTLNAGLRQLIDAIKEDCPEFDEIGFDIIRAKLTELKHICNTGCSLQIAYEQLVKNMTRGVESLKGRKGKEVIDRVLHTGYSPAIKELVTVTDGMQLTSVHMVPHLEYEKAELAEYAMEIGLSISLLDRTEEPMQLRQGKNLAKGQKQKIRSAILRYICLSMLGIGTLTLATELALAYKEKKIARLYAAISGKEVEGFRLDKQKFKTELRSFEKELKGKHSQPVFGVKTPLVSECLHWLSHYTNFSTSGLEIDEFKYDLIKYPQINNSNEIYGVVVSIGIKVHKSEALEDLLMHLENDHLAVEQLSHSKERELDFITFLYKGGI